MVSKPLVFGVIKCGQTRIKPAQLHALEFVKNKFELLLMN